MANMPFITLPYRYIHSIHRSNMTVSNTLAKLYAAIFAVAFFTKTTIQSITPYPGRWS